MDLTTLSWMLLLADRAVEIGGVALVVGLATMICGLLAFWIATMETSKEYAATLRWPRQLSYFVITLLTLAFATLAVPSEGVILRVAAIELGDEVVRSDAFQRLLDMYLPKEDGYGE